MFFYPFEVTTPHIIYALLGAFIVLFGMFSLFLREKLYIGEAIWAFIFGIIIGPYGAAIFDPRSWGHSSNPDEPINVITLEFTRVVLAIGVFAIGVELPKAYMVKHWKSLFFLLVPVMTWGWFVCAGLIYALIPGLNLLSSLAISACLTPTDPILASAVVGGKWADKHVPAHIRHLLAAESGCNDGAAFPFLFFALYLMTDLPSIGNAMRDWFLILWLYQVVLGIIIGSFLGFSFRHLMKFCQRHDLIDRQSYVAQYLSLAILSIGLTTLLGSDDLLASFACGTSFAWDGFFNKQTEESVFSSVIDILFNVAAFIFVGAWMPFNRFHQGIQIWRLIILAVLVLLLRRLPIMMGIYRWIPDVKTWREAVFSGHFGPMGIGAIFISTLAMEFLQDYLAHNPPMTTTSYQGRQIEMVTDMIQPVVAFMVLCSITIHGLSIPGFSLGRRVHSVSRTWSRRDSGRLGGPPDWTNQARLVSRAEDIVINRDLERGEPLEKTVTMISMGTTNNHSNVDEQKNVDVDGLESHSFREDTVVPVPTSTTATPAQHQDQKHSDKDRSDDPRNQFPPDGEYHQTSEWAEGDQKVIERRSSGFGDDVEVTVMNESLTNGGRSWTGQKLSELERGAEEMGHSMRDGVLRAFQFGRRSGGGDTTGMSARGGSEDAEMAMGRRPATADTVVADEDIDGPGVPDGSYSQKSAPAGPGLVIGVDTTTVAPDLPSQERRNQRGSRSLMPSRMGQSQQVLEGNLPPDIVHLTLDADYSDQLYDDYDSDAANTSNAVSRGREGGMGRMSRGTVSSSVPPPDSSILPSIIPSSTILPSESPRSRPLTRTTTTPTTSLSTTGYPPPPLGLSRLGIAGDSLIRHHNRLDFIRASDTLHSRQGHHRTPSPRESSPSRSVRFVDHTDGESGPSRDGSGGASGGNTSTDGNGGRMVGNATAIT